LFSRLSATEEDTNPVRAAVPLPNARGTARTALVIAMSAMSKKQIKKIKIKEKKKAMKELTVFVYPGCPYCAQARKIFDKLFSDGGYSDIKLTFIDETEHPEISDKYDYNACPSIYYGDKKIYEAKPLRPESKAEKMIKQALDSVEQMEE